MAAAYQAQTLPAISYYRYAGRLQEVDSTNEPHTVFEGLCAAYGA